MSGKQRQAAAPQRQAAAPQRHAAVSSGNDLIDFKMAFEQRLQDGRERELVLEALEMRGLHELRHRFREHARACGGRGGRGERS
jgi:hypothetical protein